MLVDGVDAASLRVAELASKQHGTISRSQLVALGETERAIDWANQRRIAAICTAPIHKEALAAAGVAVASSDQSSRSMSRWVP